MREESFAQAIYIQVNIHLVIHHKHFPSSFYMHFPSLEVTWFNYLPEVLNPG